MTSSGSTYNPYRILLIFKRFEKISRKYNFCSINASITDFAQETIQKLSSINFLFLFLISSRFCLQYILPTSIPFLDRRPTERSQLPLKRVRPSSVGRKRQPTTEHTSSRWHCSSPPVTAWLTTSGRAPCQSRLRNYVVFTFCVVRTRHAPLPSRPLPSSSSPALQAG